MESSSDKEWASKYLLGPLTAPQPSEETGPGSRFTSAAGLARASSTSKGPISGTTSVKQSKSPSVYPTPPGSASPSKSSFHPSNPYSPSHRQTAFGGYSESGSVGNGKGRNRGSSLGERYTGDMSHRPLDQLRKEAKAADRSPHLKRRHIPGADTIDSLDRSMLGGAYHHEGPYDATLLARNISYASSPVAAVKQSNEEALKATPREHIKDALKKHIPLQGTAVIPPGMAGLDGKPMVYEEGTDMMRDPDAPGGAYKRWADVNYVAEDLKGKGEPSYSIEKALKDHKHTTRRQIMPDGNSAYEMQTPKSRPDVLPPTKCQRKSCRHVKCKAV